LPFAVVFFEWRSIETSKTIIIFTFLICGFVIWKHRANIARIKEGTEQQISTGNGKDQAAPPEPPAPKE
jgi:glycerol-3-phosphate acyltransferase PlsY